MASLDLHALRIALESTITPYVGSYNAQIVITFIATTIVGLVMETLWRPAGQRNSLRSRLRGSAILLANLALAGIVFLWVQRKSAAFTDWHPRWALDLRVSANAPAVERWALYIIGPFVAMIVPDFFQYWWHRANHYFKPLWRMHSFHHAIREVNITNAYAHVVENVYRNICLGLFVGFLVRVDAEAAPLWTLALWAANVSVHANSRISYGILRYVIAEPRFHRVHHARERQYYDRNFCERFPVWDMLFGTAYFPAPDEHPETGLVDRREVSSWREYLTMSLDPIPPQATSEAIVEPVRSTQPA